MGDVKLDQKLLDKFEVWTTVFDSSASNLGSETNPRQAEYCPPIDTSLLRSILSDFDDSTVEQARTTLEVLKQSALAEDSLDFDASGTAGPSTHNENSPPSTDSQIEAMTRLSIGDDAQSVESMTTASEGRSASGHDESADYARLEQLDEVDEDTKLQVLLTVFGEQLPIDVVRNTLQSCNGKFNAAMEGLLNQVYFHDSENSDGETKLTFKGIEAFSQDNAGRRHRKGKPKGRNRKEPTVATDFATNPDSTTSNRWQTTAEDIDFIAARAGLAVTLVSSLYHKNGGSVPATIAAVLESSADKPELVAIDDNIKDHARKLREEFLSLSSRHAIALVRLTHPSTTFAHELAKAMSRTPAPRKGGIQIIIPRYIPPPDALETPSPRSARSWRSQSPSIDSSDAIARANEYSARSSLAYSQASNAHRLAKSNHLMGGAAAYYADVRREYSAMAHRALAHVADGTADAQSSASQLDLHNIDVANAVRIARDRVGQWWSSLGESRVNGRVGAEARQNGFRIVVGRGIHSQGGKARIAPAVAKMLKDEGWKFERQEAVILVKGRASR
jgi:hypothetical protein